MPLLITETDPTTLAGLPVAEIAARLKGTPRFRTYDEAVRASAERSQTPVKAPPVRRKANKPRVRVKGRVYGAIRVLDEPNERGLVKGKCLGCGLLSDNLPIAALASGQYRSCPNPTCGAIGAKAAELKGQISKPLNQKPKAKPKRRVNRNYLSMSDSAFDKG